MQQYRLGGRGKSASNAMVQSRQGTGRGRLTPHGAHLLKRDAHERVRRVARLLAGEWRLADGVLAAQERELLDEWR